MGENDLLILVVISMMFIVESCVQNPKPFYRFKSYLENRRPPEDNTKKSKDILGSIVKILTIVWFSICIIIGIMTLIG